MFWMFLIAVAAALVFIKLGACPYGLASPLVGKIYTALSSVHRALAAAKKSDNANSELAHPNGCMEWFLHPNTGVCLDKWHACDKP